MLFSIEHSRTADLAAIIDAASHYQFPAWARWNYRVQIDALAGGTGPEEGMQIRKVAVECGADDLAFIVDALRPSVGELAGRAQNDRGA